MADLKRRLAKGEELAFVDLYDEYGEQLFAYVAAKTRDTDSAGEIVQEVFSRLIRYHRHFKKVNNLKAYLFQVTRNEIARWLSQSGGPETAVATPISEIGVESFDSLEQRDWIASVLSNLAALDQEIVQLKIFSELTFKELAEVLDMPQASIATRYRRAIAQLETGLSKKTGMTDE